MNIKQQYLKITILVIGVITFGGSYACYNNYVTAKKQIFQSQLNTRMQSLLLQQQSVLRQLAHNILDPIKHNDITAIVANIRAYEDVLFTFSKLNLGVPVRIHFVSLSAPQEILGANGKLSNNSLVPDQKYYFDTLNNPTAIHFSRPYEQVAMPGFLLCNWGLGVLDHGANFHGQLDVQISLSALQDYLAINDFKNFRFFSFKLNHDNISQPEIVLNKHMYLYGLFLVWSAVILGLLFGLGICKIIYTRYEKRKQQQYELDILRINSSKLISEVNIIKLSQSVQYKYGILAANDADVDSLIDLQQILQDAYDVNAENALSHNINVVVPDPANGSLRFYGNRLRIMQILSGIISEGIHILPANSMLALQVEVVHLQDNLCQITFKFQDNGFYNKLEHRNVQVSHTDVRVQGWDNINYLVDLELGELQHVHTAYTGNVISVAVTRKLQQKVFNIEHYS